MSFIADKQTLDDLRMTGRFRGDAIFGLFDRTRTAGGQQLLESLFAQPLLDPEEINRRSELFAYFKRYSLEFPFEKDNLEAFATYMGEPNAGGFILRVLDVWKKQGAALIFMDQQYERLKHGIQAAINVFKCLKRFLEKVPEQETWNELWKGLPLLKHVLSASSLLAMQNEAEIDRWSVFKVARYDDVLRRIHRSDLKQMLEQIYWLDVCISVGEVARERNFSRAIALPGTVNLLEAEGLFHPKVRNAVGNHLHFSEEKNVLFLTGANMAGKSTLMKSVGVAMYLAHMGFPVAAQSMRFSVKEGLYSSINVPDNLNMGYSHFYAEVLRVKRVAEDVSDGKTLFVLFDELFKGTNVKDAYDATLAITEELASYSSCFFIISTHIIEVGEVLGQRCQNISFGYMPTELMGNIPRYPYRLTQGITSDRQGMMIIENEQILKLLE